MGRKIISLGTLLSVLTALLSGCGTVHTSSQDTMQTTEQPAVQETKEPATVIHTDGTDDFTASLIRFIEENGYKDKNYIISPASFRAALALAAAGADSNTKEELLSAMGFNNMEDLNRLYSSVTASEARFNQWLNGQLPHSNTEVIGCGL